MGHGRWNAQPFGIIMGVEHGGRHLGTVPAAGALGLPVIFRRLPRCYMRSGSGTPSSPRPVVSTRSTAAHRARRDCRISSSSAFSTGHCS
jgi:hypothetical protein